MSASRSANLALVLVVLGWLLAYYGVMSQFGDPAPSVARSVIESQRHVSLAVWLLGLMCLVGSLWLSGRSFAAARRRSLLALASVVVPIVFLLAQLY